MALQWWTGVIEDRNDPEKLGRVRVRIFGIHSENRQILSTQELPWASISIPFGLTPNSHFNGAFEGAYVAGIFLDNDAQDPLVLSFLPGRTESSPDRSKGFCDFRPLQSPLWNTQLTRKESPRKLQSKVWQNITLDSSFNPNSNGVLQQETNGRVPTVPGFPLKDGSANLNDSELNRTDIPTYASTEERSTNEADKVYAEKSKVAQKGLPSAGDNGWSEPDSSGIQPIYPFNSVIQTESGHLLEWDDTPGKERIHTYHRCGSNLDMWSDGTTQLKSSGHLYTIAVRNYYIHTDGGADWIFDKTLNIHVNRDKEPNSKNNILVGQGGSLKVELKGVDDGQGGNVELRFELGTNGDLLIKMKKGDLKIEQGEGDIVITQRKGDFQHNVLEGNYTLNIPNGKMIVMTDKGIVATAKGGPFVFDTVVNKDGPNEKRSTFILSTDAIIHTTTGIYQCVCKSWTAVVDSVSINLRTLWEQFQSLINRKG